MTTSAINAVRIEKGGGGGVTPASRSTHAIERDER